MSGQIISVPIQIRFADVDLAQHAHNAVYLHWFESARMVLFNSFLPGDHDWFSQGIILARNEIDYRSPVKLTDRIEVETSCGSIGSKSFDLNYRVVRKGDRSGICAEGRSVLVCFDLKANKSIQIPREWRSALEKFRNDKEHPSPSPADRK
ncbi:MAG: acyl-CoA thioesterase [Bacteroidota bacterium]|nr:acyl-CoA thioesterase [Bacteroidota bacterium]